MTFFRSADHMDMDGREKKWETKWSPQSTHALFLLYLDKMSKYGKI